MTLRTAEEWDARFRTWAGGPGDTELERCGNAERMIRKAIAASTSLKDLDIEVFAQGSFRNITPASAEINSWSSSGQRVSATPCCSFPP